MATKKSKKSASRFTEKWEKKKKREKIFSVCGTVFFLLVMVSALIFMVYYMATDRKSDKWDIRGHWLTEDRTMHLIITPDVIFIEEWDAKEMKKKLYAEGTYELDYKNGKIVYLMKTARTDPKMTEIPYELKKDSLKWNMNGKELIFHRVEKDEPLIKKD